MRPTAWLVFALGAFACGPAPYATTPDSTAPEAFRDLDGSKLETPCGPPSVPEAWCDRRNRVVGVWTDRAGPGSVSGWLAPELEITAEARGEMLWVRADCSHCRVPTGWTFVGEPARLNDGQRKILAERLRLATVPTDARAFADAAATARAP